MSDLKRIQIFIVINDLKIVILVNFEVTRNVILTKFVIKHELRTMRKQLVTKLYNFDEKRIKENVSQKLLTLIKMIDKISNIIFDVIDTTKDVFLKYS